MLEFAFRYLFPRTKKLFAVSVTKMSVLVRVLQIKKLR